MVQCCSPHIIIFINSYIYQLITISGLLPLGAAAYMGYSEICDLLLTHGAYKGNLKTGNNTNVDIKFWALSYY